MTRNQMQWLKGLGLGMAAGIMAGATAGVAATCCMKRRKHGFKYNMGKALQSMGELVDNMSGMF